MLKSATTFVVAVLMATYLSSAAHATTIMEHLKLVVPVSEGWTSNADGFNVVEGPVPNDLGSGFDAWKIDDQTAQLNTGGRFYTFVPSITDTETAKNDGWTLTTRLRIVEPNEAVDRGIFVEYIDRVTRWRMDFGSDDNSDPIVMLQTGHDPNNINDDVGIVISLTGSGSGYHLYQLRYDPIALTTDFYFDGIKIHSGFAGMPTSLHRVAFGAGKKLGTGHANYNLVKLEIGPAAHAGPDQTVDEGTPVMLDGGASSMGAFSTTEWQQIAIGDYEVVLDDTASLTPNFVAPILPDGVPSTVLTFELTITDVPIDGVEVVSTDTVDVTVSNFNTAPVADAGADQTVNEGVEVTLDGSMGSFDSDGGPSSLEYDWLQTSGPSVTLSEVTAADPTFDAPLLDGGTGASVFLTFELEVCDGLECAYDTVEITVEQVNHAPIADAGLDQTVNEGSSVFLNGAGSSDPDDDDLYFSWTQTSGLSVIFDDSIANPDFTAPNVTAQTDLVFALTVGDGELDSPEDEVVITVQDINDPPSCNLAAADPSVLWPPTHKMVEVGITGISDPNDDGITITIIDVTQDEPVNDVGDGDTGPDAALQEGSVLIRAERMGGKSSPGDGRVYKLYFSATDGIATCSGSVEVKVPHDRKRAAVDSGQNYDSTVEQ